MSVLVHIICTTLGCTTKLPQQREMNANCVSMESRKAPPGVHLSCVKPISAFNTLCKK